MHPDTQKLRRIEELMKPQWRRLPIKDIPETTVDAYVAGRNEVIDQVRDVLAGMDPALRQPSR